MGPVRPLNQSYPPHSRKGSQEAPVALIVDKEPPELPSSAMEPIKNVVEAPAVEMGIDVHILISIILGTGRGLKNVKSTAVCTVANGHYNCRSGTDMPV